MVGCKHPLCKAHAPGLELSSQFVDEERQESCYHCVGRKMCKTEYTQMQNLNETQKPELSKYSSNPSGHFTPTKLPMVQD